MKNEEIVERGFTIAKDGRIIDDMGNEYRDEDGQVVFLEE